MYKILLSIVAFVMSERKLAGPANNVINMNEKHQIP